MKNGAIPLPACLFFCQVWQFRYWGCKFIIVKNHLIRDEFIGKVFVTYDYFRSLKAKCEFVNEQNIAGTFQMVEFWKITYSYGCRIEE